MARRVGLTGGIASGKSTVSRRLAELGAVVIDYDLLAREVLEPGSRGLEMIAQRFGPAVITAEGTLDRPGLGALVFADPAALKDLEPFIVSGKRILEIKHKDVKGSSRVVAMNDGKGGVRVLVYGLTCDNECSFELPAAFGKMVSTCGNVREKDGTYVYSGREFTCDVLKPAKKRIAPR